MLKCNSCGSEDVYLWGQYKNKVEYCCLNCENTFLSNLCPVCKKRPADIIVSLLGGYSVECKICRLGCMINNIKEDIKKLPELEKQLKEMREKENE